MRNKFRVMPGFMPGIHVFRHSQGKDVDGRDKPGHDKKIQRENFLYFSRCGMTESVPSRRILSAS